MFTVHHQWIISIRCLWRELEQLHLASGPCNLVQPCESIKQQKEAHCGRSKNLNCTDTGVIWCISSLVSFWFLYRCPELLYLFLCGAPYYTADPLWFGFFPIILFQNPNGHRPRFSKPNVEKKKKVKVLSGCFWSQVWHPCILMGFYFILFF